MSTPHAEGQRPTYDRAFLLSDGKRNQVMELWEVQQFGIDSFADPEYVCLYGMPPTEWYRRGIRLLARTTLEAVRDRLGDLIGQDVARVLHKAPSHHDMCGHRPVRRVVQRPVLDLASCAERAGAGVRDRQDDLRHNHTEPAHRGSG
jgi:hypothetical protein